jgi:hypothetical protein
VPSGITGLWKAFIEGRDRWGGDDFIRVSGFEGNRTCRCLAAHPKGGQ